MVRNPTRSALRSSDASVRYGIAESSLGPVLVGFSDHGVCALLLLMGETSEVGVERLRELYPLALFERDDLLARSIASRVGSYLSGEDDCSDVKLDLSAGTGFRRKVWEAVRLIPRGETRSYGEIAEQVGSPRAARAVGSACGANPIALLIPCHRVVGSGTSLGGYGWGLERKLALLELEQA